MYYDDSGNPVNDELPYANPYLTPATPAIQSAPSSGPLYSGSAGSSYTDWNGQAQTVPTQTTTYANQPEYTALWNSVGHDPQQFVQAIIQKLGLHGRQIDPTALNTIVGHLKSVGVNAALDSRTDGYHKGIMLNGQFVKLLDGNDQWMYGPAGGESGDQSAVAPFTEPFTTSAQLINFNKAPAFDYPDFQAPTGDSILKDPSFQFRLDEGRKALEGSKAAKGTLRTGGTLRDVLSLGQNLASTEYGHIFDRSIAQYDTNRANAAGKYQTNLQSQFNDPYQYDVANEKERYSRDWNEFLDRKSTFYGNEDRAYAKQMGAANLGFGAASA